MNDKLSKYLQLLKFLHETYRLIVPLCHNRIDTCHDKYHSQKQKLFLPRDFVPQRASRIKLSDDEKEEEENRNSSINFEGRKRNRAKANNTVAAVFGSIIGG